MKIQVLGSGCSTCKKLFETTKAVVNDLKMKTEVEYITDVAKMIEIGVLTSPVLVIDGKPVLTGKGHGREDIKKALIDKCSSEGNKNCCPGCCG